MEWNPYNKALYADSLFRYLKQKQSCHWYDAERWAQSDIDDFCPSRARLLVVRRWLASLGLLWENGKARVTRITLTPLGRQVSAIEKYSLQYFFMLAQYGSIEDGTVADDMALARLLRDFRGPHFRAAMNKLSNQDLKSKEQEPMQYSVHENRLRYTSGRVAHPMSYHLWFKDFSSRMFQQMGGS